MKEDNPPLSTEFKNGRQEVPAAMSQTTASLLSDLKNKRATCLEAKLTEEA